MDPTSILIVGVFLGSMSIAGKLARDMGRSQSHWAWTAAFIGPLAPALLCLVAAASVFRKAIGGCRA